jgi:hypothetical protein
VKVCGTGFLERPNFGIGLVNKILPGLGKNGINNVSSVLGEEMPGI